MGMWKDIFSPRRGKQFQICSCAQEKRSECIWREGRVQEELPSLSSLSGLEKPAAIFPFSAGCEEKPSRGSCLTAGGFEPHWSPFLPNLVQSSWQSSRQISSIAKIINPSLKAQISTDDLCYSKSAWNPDTWCRPPNPGGSTGSSFTPITKVELPNFLTYTSRIMSQKQRKYHLHILKIEHTRWAVAWKAAAPEQKPICSRKKPHTRQAGAEPAGWMFWSHMQPSP